MKELTARFLKSSAELLGWTEFCLLFFVVYGVVAADMNIEEENISMYSQLLPHIMIFNTTKLPIHHMN